MPAQDKRVVANWIGKLQKKLTLPSDWILLTALAALYSVVNTANLLQQMLFVGHFGLFLLWQPILSQQMQLKAGGMLLVLGVLAFMTLLMGPWMLLGWGIFLAALLGGRSFASENMLSRRFHLVAFATLLLLLLTRLLPDVLPVLAADKLDLLAISKYLLPAFFIVLCVLSVSRAHSQADQVVDYLAGLFLYLMLAVLCLGTLAYMALASLSYFQSVLSALLTTSALLLLVSWAWNPRAGFSGLGVLFSRYVFTIAMPYEGWLSSLTDFAQQEDDPERFLHGALKRLCRLPGVVGGSWIEGENEQHFGRVTPCVSHFQQDGLELHLYTSTPLAAGLAWHFELLVRLLAEFYFAKQRGAQLQQLSYVRAIHDTGARLTHDVKNLLQSLNTLCYAINSQPERDPTELNQLISRQLPVITQRLQHTLDKLQKPDAEEAASISVSQWWNQMRERYTEHEVQFLQKTTPCTNEVAGQALSSILETLLDNAMLKRAAQTDMRVEVQLLRCEPLEILVRDSGHPIAAEMVGKLFVQPVESSKGFGVGLYQAAQLAMRHDWQLTLSENRPGEVVFSLRGKSSLNM